MKLRQSIFCEIQRNIAGWRVCAATVAAGALLLGYDIYVMNSDGSNQIRLTYHPGGDGTPSSSPDGSRIVFGSFRNGNSEIYAMNSNGTNQIG